MYSKIHCKLFYYLLNLQTFIKNTTVVPELEDSLSPLFRALYLTRKLRIMIWVDLHLGLNLPLGHSLRLLVRMLETPRQSQKDVEVAFFYLYFLR